MGTRLAALLVFATTAACAQAPQPSVRVEVKTDAGPLRDATVTVSGHTVKTGVDGVAVVPATTGNVEVIISKDGFFSAHASVAVEPSQQAAVEVELQPEKAEEEQVTVYATRTNVRLQDSPLHV